MFLSSTPGSGTPWLFLWTSWPCVEAADRQPSPRARLESALCLGDRCSIGSGCKGEQQDSAVFGGTPFALSVMESRTLPGFAPRISVLGLKSMENCAACLSLPQVRSQ